MGKWLWVLGGGQMQLPVVHKAHEMGYKVIVSDMSDKCICKDIADAFFDIDIFNIEGHMSQLTHCIEQLHYSIDGVVCIGVDCPETAATMQTHLRKPTATPEIAHLCHSKRDFRKAMRQLGYPTPRYKLVGPTADVIPPNYAPFIVKNSDSSGSRGTTIFYEQPTFRHFYSAIDLARSASRDGWAIIEELWEGTEHTVETLFDAQGHFHPCFITDRYFDKSDGFALETGLRHPSTLPDYLQRKAYQIAEQLGNDLGITGGPLKLDIIVTDGGIRIIEATTRFSGGFDCQYLVPAATGKDIIQAAIMVSTGKMITENVFSTFDSCLRGNKYRVSLSSSIWPLPGIITSITGVDEALAIPGVEHVILRKEVGDVVEPYTDCTKRVAFIITSGVTEEEAQVAMTMAKNRINIEVGD